MYIYIDGASRYVDNTLPHTSTQGVDTNNTCVVHVYIQIYVYVYMHIYIYRYGADTWTTHATLTIHSNTLTLTTTLTHFNIYIQMLYIQTAREQILNNAKDNEALYALP